MRRLYLKRLADGIAQAAIEKSENGNRVGLVRRQKKRVMMFNMGLLYIPVIACAMGGQM